jgi:hypothetical protein
MKKNSILFSFLIGMAPFLSAQIIPVKNAFQTELAHVISDYTAGFKNMAGDESASNPQSREYNCRTQVKDAMDCKVIKYSSATKEIYSWEATMLKTEEFKEAEKKFHSLFNSIQNLSTNINGYRVVFKSQYEKPTEEKKFSSIIFSAAEKYADLAMLKVELLMEAGLVDWTIKVLVYEKQKEDGERGKIID